MASLALLVSYLYLVGWAYARQSPGANAPRAQATNATIFALEVIIRHRFCTFHDAKVTSMAILFTNGLHL
jgi:hypothetical protein